jgi:pyrroline-5-carboxylate reductase
MKLTILGCGKIGEAVLSGLLASRTVKPDDVVVTTKTADRAAKLGDRHGVRATTDNAEAVQTASTVLLCVKPQRAREVLTGLAGPLAGRLLISTVAGIELAQLEEWSPESRVIRSMPNTPCLIREGMTVISPGSGATDDDLDAGRSIFQSVGRCLVLEEQHMNAVTGLSGSGPAFAYVFLEALADGGVMMGLPRDAALELAAQTAQGAARMVLQGGSHPAALKDEVTTPAGCTIAGLLTMEDGRIRSTLARAIQEATRVAASLGKT